VPTELTITLREPHEAQQTILDNLKKRNIWRCGRRFGKTTIAATIAVGAFLDGRRVLYGAPTNDQVGRFWFEVKRGLEEPVEHGYFYKNESQHIIELPKTEQRIRAKTAWNADTLRGDYADLLILDEYQLMSADAWGVVGAPMLLDNNGDAIFIFTSRRGQYHAKELYKKAQADKTGRWSVLSFPSHANPYLSGEALAEITGDMSSLDYRAEILAEDIEDDPRAIWTRDIIDHVTGFPDLVRVVVGVDPPGSHEGAECGIVAGGIAVVYGELHVYIVADHSRRGTPGEWGSACVSTYNLHSADRVVVERNFGGEMAAHVITTSPGGQDVPIKEVTASRGKAIRAEPVEGFYERGRVHHVGEFTALEDEMCMWVPGSGMPSPNRVDALVWVVTELLLGQKKKKKAAAGLR